MIIDKCIRCNGKVNKEIITKMYVCPSCKVFVANQYHSDNLEGGKRFMAKKKEVEEALVAKTGVAKVSLSSQIRDLLTKNKSVEEIMKELNCPRKKILDQRWLLAHKK